MAERQPNRRSASVLGTPSATIIKVALLGDSQVGKTSLMQRFCEGNFDETQLQTQGVNFMERIVSLGDQEVTFSLWDIGGHIESEAMLPLVCNDAAALLHLQIAWRGGPVSLGRAARTWALPTCTSRSMAAMTPRASAQTTSTQFTSIAGAAWPPRFFLLVE